MGIQYRVVWAETPEEVSTEYSNYHEQVMADRLLTLVTRAQNTSIDRPEEADLEPPVLTWKDFEEALPISLKVRFQERDSEIPDEEGRTPGMLDLLVGSHQGGLVERNGFGNTFGEIGDKRVVVADTAMVLYTDMTARQYKILLTATNLLGYCNRRSGRGWR